MLTVLPYGICCKICFIHLSSNIVHKKSVIYITKVLFSSYISVLYNAVCSDPTAPTNGTVSVSVDKTTAIYTCDVWTTLNGVSPQSCGNDGTGWSSTDPECGKQFVSGCFVDAYKLAFIMFKTHNCNHVIQCILHSYNVWCI